MAFLGNKYIKLLIIFILFLFFIFVSPNYSKASLIVNDSYTTDIWSATRDKYDSTLENIYMQIFFNWNSYTQSEKNIVKDFINRLSTGGMYCETEAITYNGHTLLQYNVFIYDVMDFTYEFGDNQFLITYDNNTTDVPQFAIGEYKNMTITYCYRFRSPSFLKYYPNFTKVSGGTPQTVGISNKITIWSSFIGYYGNHNVLKSLINGVNNDFQYSDIQDIGVLLSVISKNTKDNADSTKELTDFVKDDSIDSSSSDFQTSSNINSSSFDNAIGIGLNSMINKLNSGDSPDIVFPIPHTNNNITLKGNYISSNLYNNNSAWVVGFINMIWTFVIYGWIIKDIWSIFDELKSGDIINSKQTNIQKEML